MPKLARFCRNFGILAITGQRNLTLLKEAILATLDEIQKAGQSVKIHVLGTGSPKILSFYIAQGITSFDSATWLRQAWMSGKHNYFMANGTQHTSYRATRIGLGPLEAGSLEWATSITCPFCQDLGQQILFFRGHERNTRRGFHNIYQYIQLLKAQHDMNQTRAEFTESTSVD